MMRLHDVSNRNAYRTGNREWEGETKKSDPWPVFFDRRGRQELRFVQELTRRLSIAVLDISLCPKCTAMVVISARLQLLEKLGNLKGCFANVIKLVLPVMLPANRN
ncbi:hypothetical protein OPV22_023535 [Ensete ventricosum]|uniref:Uncharacterized protein n=1 Tax=Ensete ventricosum TaxID=4639 RepID=A0AAV8QQW8_ENSVE|nr:hypothetical protein OPV22_023535 [Ensete ventricosum]